MGGSFNLRDSLIVSEDLPLLMIPGPTPVPPAVLAALAEPARSHTGPENARTVRRIQEMLSQLVGSSQAVVHVIAGSGTLAMEASVVNHVAPGQRVVIVSHGYFGDRFAEIARSLGATVSHLGVEWGRHVDPSELREVLKSGAEPRLVTMTHAETSTGVLADCARLTAIVREEAPEAIVVIDGICATGGIPQAMDDWGVDVILTGAQKALSVPPGLAILALSPRAVEARDRLGSIQAYYSDLARWAPSVQDPTHYFSTYPTSLLRGLEASLDEIVREGLDSRFARHRHLAELLRQGMHELGFSLMTDPECLAPTLSVLAVPPGTEEQHIRSRMLESGVLVAGCLGPWAGRGIRVGHMGCVTEADIDRTVQAAARAVRQKPERRSGG